MGRPKIIIDDKIPFIKGALEDSAEVIYLPGNEIGPEEVKDADALIIRTRTKCNRDLLEGSKIKFIATATIGFDHIDTEYCERQAIRWTNAPGCNSSSVEQYILSVLLYLFSLNRFRPGKMTVGIVGVGNVGKKVKRACSALGFNVLCNDPPRQRLEGEEGFTDLGHLLQHSDIVTMHVPLSMEGEDKTFGMAGKEFFATLKEGAVFINSSRGEVVDETALKESIRGGRLGRAVLDVYNNEPGIDRELLEMLTIATPHIAGYSVDGKLNGTIMSVEAVKNFFNIDKGTWTPSNVPEPDSPEIFADGSEDDTLGLISEIYMSVYDVKADHDLLIQSPENFEMLRGKYRIRREPHAFNVRLYNDDGKYRNILEQLGFAVIGDSCF